MLFCKLGPSLSAWFSERMFFKYILNAIFFKSLIALVYYKYHFDLHRTGPYFLGGITTPYIYKLHYIALLSFLFSSEIIIFLFWETSGKGKIMWVLCLLAGAVLGSMDVSTTHCKDPENAFPTSTEITDCSKQDWRKNSFCKFTCAADYHSEGAACKKCLTKSFSIKS